MRNRVRIPKKETKWCSAGCCTCICCLAVILTVILVLVGLKQVEQDELAIEENTWSMLINENPMSEGRYVLSPVSKLHKFKRILQTLDYTDGNEIHCLTSEGLDMELDITAQYQLRREELLDLFYEFGSEKAHRIYIDSVTRAELKDVCTNFTGEDYFLKRGDIEQTMGEELQQVYEVSRAHADFSLIQLRNVKHPKLYEDANQAKQSQQQEKAKVLRERQEQLTHAKTELKTTLVDADIKLIQGNATATSAIKKAETEAPAEIKFWKDRTDAFVNIKKGMGNVSISEFIDYIENILVLESQENPIIQL